jgi:hypothetical protein
MIADFERGSASLPAKLDILTIRVSAKAFGNVRRDGHGGPPQLTGENVSLVVGELMRDGVYGLAQLPRELPDVQISEVSY